MATRAAARPMTTTANRPAAAPRHSLRQNALAMVLGQGTTWVLTAVTLALLPRYLGPEAMGRYAIGISYADIAATVAGLGMATLVTREVARDPARGAAMLGTALWLNVLLGVTAGAVSAGVGLALGYERATQLVIVAMAFTVPFNLVSLLAFGALQGAEVMRYQAVFDAAGKLALLVATAVIIVFDLGLTAYIGVWVVMSVLWGLPGLFIVRKYVPYDPFAVSLRMARELVIESIPFCSASVFLVFYLAVDVMLLSVLADEGAVGIYGPASRIFGTLLFAPTIIMTIMFPRLSAVAHNAPGRFGELAVTTLKVVGGITIPVAVLAAGLSAPMLRILLGGEFDDTHAVMAVLAFALVPTSLNMIAHRVLVAVDRQRAWTYVMGAGFVAKVALDFALIQLAEAWWGNAALGAAMGLLLVEGGMTVVGIALLPQGIAGPQLAWHGVRLVAAGAVAFLAILVAEPAGFVVAGAAGVAAYVLTAFGLAVYTPRETVAAVAWLRGRGGAEAAEDALEVPPAPLFAPAEGPVLLYAPGRLKAVRPARTSPSS
ncbi:MAG: flippase [Dehalococcoidia bacterium]|nr:flippase [Dehalococcoidia bacterium]